MAVKFPILRMFILFLFIRLSRRVLQRNDAKSSTNKVNDLLDPEHWTPDSGVDRILRALARIHSGGGPSIPPKTTIAVIGDQ